ncbi:MAG: lysine--tRNA ligase [Clostridia bacterium]|nr:lysine--tRNA ligase [Clostridia bacterium]
MHWADEIAQTLIKKHPNTQVFTCACGISPSGVVHIGNFREIITAYFVGKGLKDLGKDVRFIYSWDSFDRLRKIAKGIPLDEKYIGMPYSEVPDPFGTEKSYEDHFEKPLMDALKEIGIDCEFIFQSKEYKSGRYVKGIVESLKKRKQIYDIMMKFKTQSASDEERENYVPLELYCQKCGHDFTKITKISDDSTKLDYVCKCGNSGTVDVTKDFCVKLVWKVDWPMRWREEGVMFEPGGRDHSSQGGSYQVSSVIAKEIFGIEPPEYRMYDFINLKGQTKKISSSSGTDMSPQTLLKVYEPAVMLWMFTRFLPEKSFDIAMDSDVLKTYHEFDRMYAQYKSGQCDEMVKRIMELALSTTTEKDFVPVDASLIASFAPIVNFDLDLLTELFKKLGQNWTKEQIKPRFERITHWLKTYCPEQIVNLLDSKNDEFYNTLSDEEKGWIKTLKNEIQNKNLSLEDMQSLLYDIPKLNGEMDKARQKRFFEIVYNLLIGLNKGPRLYLFLTALNKNEIIKLLDF